MDFRFADESDTGNLLTLINQAFAVEAFFHIGTRLDPARIQPYFQKGRFLVAESNGALKIVEHTVHDAAAITAKSEATS